MLSTGWICVRLSDLLTFQYRCPHLIRSPSCDAASGENKQVLHADAPKGQTTFAQQHRRPDGQEVTVPGHVYGEGGMTILTADSIK
jgi:hypothetical protein